MRSSVVHGDVTIVAKVSVRGTHVVTTLVEAVKG